MNILVIDTGSSNMRGVILKKKGEFLTSFVQHYYMSTNSSGICEMHPEIYHNALLSICKDASVYCYNNNITLDALALTSQRSSVLALSKDLSPLGNIIMWHDKRSSEICSRFSQETLDYMYSISGTNLTPILSAPKMLFIKEQYPELYAKAYKLVGIQEYLLSLITGKLVTDTSFASRTGLLDIKTKTWSSQLLNLFHLSEDKLCRLASPGDIIGFTSDSFSTLSNLKAGLPVISAGGDQQCAILGQGIEEPSHFCVSIGTGSYISTILEQPFFSSRRSLNLSVAVTPGKWIIEASTFSSGLTYQWFYNSFYQEKERDYSKINQEIASIPPSLANPIMLPYIAGKGSPDWDSYATGIFYNITPSSSRAEFARAVIEGIASEIADCINELCSQLNMDIKEVLICGGLSKQPALIHAIADMTNLPVALSPVTESTILGAWISAACSLGLYQTQKEARQSLSFCQKTTAVSPDKENVNLYKKINTVRSVLYKKIPFTEISSLLN